MDCGAICLVRLHIRYTISTTTTAAETLKHYCTCMVFIFEGIKLFEVKQKPNLKLEIVK